MSKRFTAALALALAVFTTPALASSPSPKLLTCGVGCGGGNQSTVTGSQTFYDGGPLSGINGDGTSMKVTISGTWRWDGSAVAFVSGPGCSAQTYNGVGGGITGSSHTVSSTMVTFICYATETTPFYTHKLAIYLYAYANGSSAITSSYLS